jgi:hypothetical protein
VESVGGQLVGSYHDPLGREPVLVAILPIEASSAVPARFVAGTTAGSPTFWTARGCSWIRSSPSPHLKGRWTPSRFAPG